MNVFVHALLGFIAGFWSRRFINNFVDDEIKYGLHFETEGADEISRALDDVYNPGEDYIVKTRDINMYLNTVSMSQLVLPGQIKSVHLTVAAGHTNMFNHFINEKNQVGESREYLESIINKTCKVVEDFPEEFALPEDPDLANMTRIQASANLVKGYYLYNPPMIRINKDYTENRIADMQPKDNPEREVITPFEIWCQVMEERDLEMIDSNLRDILKLSVALQFLKLELYYTNSEDTEKIISWPGDPQDINKEYEFFGYKVNFARGLPVGFEEIATS